MVDGGSVWVALFADVVFVVRWPSWMSGRIVWLCFQYFHLLEVAVEVDVAVFAQHRDDTTGNLRQYVSVVSIFFTFRATVVTVGDGSVVLWRSFAFGRWCVRRCTFLRYCC